MDEQLLDICKKASAVKYDVQKLSTEQKNHLLYTAAEGLKENCPKILEANRQDMERGRAGGMSPAMLDRLLLTKERIDSIADGLVQIAELPDPAGKVISEEIRPNGMKIRKVSVPMGVIGIIYEARPNVTADAFSLCFKAGSAVILKGGSDAIASNMAIVNALRASLSEEGIDPDALQLITSTSREVTAEFMKMKEYVDVLIPRGSAGLIRAVTENSRIPVIETGVGNCHIYIDRAADFQKAINIIVNAKTQRIGVCNAAESLVVHDEIREQFLPLLSRVMQEKKVLLRADESSLSLLPYAEAAEEADFGKEYLDYILSVKTVSSLEEAIQHINHYHTAHSDCIITEDPSAAEKFLSEVDSACVYWNVSTRFTDGFEFGFGAEIGISTQKLHARGPMGLEELMSYKYRISGNGQIRS